ncbi:hypothetical protein E5983_00950 [Streptococcus danieliae]|uniref:HeH/LEM domain-containing protein n=1 Tax=Streptococcus danieliae TaxID=747656 RepID=A0A7X3KB49_9STRE|nr:HeH/LEM domain-containing protein [Streptococcus danieliae]MVX58241.1 hypothetical protein [Streptococcus danieliae]
MGNVIKTFRCKETQEIYYIGETYKGGRTEELTALGFLSDELSSLKLDELRAKLDERGIEYNPKAKKQELLDLLS